MIKILDKCYELRGDPTAFYMDQDHGAIDWDNCTDHAFMGGRVCVLFVPISAIDVMKVESDFTIGILPNPKFDEKQEAYHTVPNLGNGSLLSVPSTVLNREFAGYGLEAITEESVNTSYITYIEEKSKLQNATDADCAKCMQIIFDGVVYDIGFISDIGGLGSLVRNTLGSNTTNNYSRLFSRTQKIAENELKKIREAYAAME
jgi:cytochrome b involved in lipid metabolism